MKALMIHLNGKKLCLAGIASGVQASIGPLGEDASEYSMDVYGCDLLTRNVFLWPGAKLETGDQVTIALVEVDEADPPEILEDS